jgi:cyanophycinase
MRSSAALILAFFSLLAAAQAPHSPYRYHRAGNPKDVATVPEWGLALMGGGSDLDEAFRWLCNKANGGDFLVLRAVGDDGYNSYLSNLCKLNSVATLIIPSRKAAKAPKVAEIIRSAEVIFIAGGDQSRYVNFWRGTPVRDAINEHIAARKPIGGTSAGLAVLGEFAYAALKDAPDDADLASQDVLPNPYHARVTLVRDFLKIPELQNTITDTHFNKRERMGRSLVFLARLMQDGWSRSPREIAVDEQSALLVESDGKGTVVGTGDGAYLIQPRRAPDDCAPNRPLIFRDISVYRAPARAHFDLRSWSGTGGMEYSASIEAGMLRYSAVE